MRRTAGLTAIIAMDAVSMTHPAIAETAPGMNDLIGSRTPGAEMELRARGYELAGNKAGTSPRHPALRKP